jgi:hypothetical protein
MNDARKTQERDSARRLGARRRATKGLIANYIHELSDRHGGSAKPLGAPPRSS